MGQPLIAKLDIHKYSIKPSQLCSVKEFHGQLSVFHFRHPDQSNARTKKKEANGFGNRS